jgi:uncharacterized protein (TIGR02118 family)
MSTPDISYFVRYEGEAENQQAFLAYYRDRHAPILARFPGIRRIVLHTPAACQDPFPVKPDRFALVAQMIFDTKEDLDNALHSEERAIAREDFGSFPPFRGLVYHQATISEEVFSR